MPSLLKKWFGKSKHKRAESVLTLRSAPDTLKTRRQSTVSAPECICKCHFRRMGMDMDLCVDKEDRGVGTAKAMMDEGIQAAPLSVGETEVESQRTLGPAYPRHIEPEPAYMSLDRVHAVLGVSIVSADTSLMATVEAQESVDAEQSQETMPRLVPLPVSRPDTPHSDVETEELLGIEAFYPTETYTPCLETSDALCTSDHAPPTSDPSLTLPRPPLPHQPTSTTPKSAGQSALLQAQVLALSPSLPITQASYEEALVTLRAFQAACIAAEEIAEEESRRRFKHFQDMYYVEKEIQEKHEAAMQLLGALKRRGEAKGLVERTFGSPLDAEPEGDDSPIEDDDEEKLRDDGPAPQDTVRLFISRMGRTAHFDPLD